MYATDYKARVTPKGQVPTTIGCAKRPAGRRHNRSTVSSNVIGPQMKREMVRVGSPCRPKSDLRTCGNIKSS